MRREYQGQKTTEQQPPLNQEELIKFKKFLDNL